MTEYFKQVRLPNGSLYSVLDAEAARTDHHHEEYLTQDAADQLYLPIGTDLGAGYLTQTAADNRYSLLDHNHSEYLTKTQADTYYADINHNHDERYALKDHSHDYSSLDATYNSEQEMIIIE